GRAALSDRAPGIELRQSRHESGTAATGRPVRPGRVRGIAAPEAPDRAAHEVRQRGSAGDHPHDAGGPDRGRRGPVLLSRGTGLVAAGCAHSYRGASRRPRQSFFAGVSSFLWNGLILPSARTTRLPGFCGFAAGSSGAAGSISGAVLESAGTG